MEALLLIKANDAVQQLVDSSLVCTAQGMRKGSSGMIILQGIHLFPASASLLLQRAHSAVHSVNFPKGNFTVKRESLLYNKLYNKEVGLSCFQGGLIMKKFFNRLFCLVLIVSFVSGFIPVQTEAATVIGQYKIYTLPQKKWVKSPVYSGNRQVFYKFKITSSGYYKIQFDDSKLKRNRHNLAGVQILNTYRYDDDDVTYLRWERSSEGKTAYGVLPKGRYYLFSNSENLRFKYEFIKMSRPSNTTKAKAKSLKRSVNKRFLFDYNSKYPVWYKVKLTAKHKIRIFAQDKAGSVDPNVLVFNSKGKKIKTTALNDYMCQTAAVSKGTYYIRLSRETGYDKHRFRRSGSGFHQGRYISFTWNQY